MGINQDIVSFSALFILLVFDGLSVWPHQGGGKVNLLFSFPLDFAWKAATHDFTGTI